MGVGWFSNILESGYVFMGVCCVIFFAVVWIWKVSWYKRTINIALIIYNFLLQKEIKYTHITRRQKLMSYMDRNVTRWEIQFLDIWSGLIQKGCQVRSIVSKAVWSGDRAGRTSPCTAPSHEDGWSSYPGYTERKSSYSDFTARNEQRSSFSCG